MAPPNAEPIDFHQENSDETPSHMPLHPTSHSAGDRHFGMINTLGLWTFYRKEVHRFLKVAFQTVLAPVMSTLLFLVVFTLALGADRGDVAGTPYVVFLAPGMIMMAILNNSFANSSSSLIIGKVQGSIVDMLMAPLSSAELATGFIAGAATRGLLVGFVTTLTCAAFMAMSHPMGVSNVFAILYFGLSAALMFAMFGVLGGIWAEKFDQLAAVTNFVIQPLTFLSGTFYPISRLPEPILSISKINPVFMMVDGFRYGFTGQSETSILMSAVIVFGINIVLAYVCYRLLKSGYKIKS